MVNRSYVKGYNFERRVKKYLEGKGYYCIRSSKSRFPDLVAVKKEYTIFIECKCNKYLSAEEKEEFGRLLEYGEVALAYRDGRKIVFACPFDYKTKNI